MTTPLKAYQFHTGDPYEYATLIFARSQREAKRLGWKLWEYHEDGYLSARAWRLPNADSLVRAGATEPYEERDSRVLRKAHWHCDGDASCASCGLYEMDGDYPVCEYCLQCIEHEDVRDGKRGSWYRLVA